MKKFTEFIKKPLLSILTLGLLGQMAFAAQPILDPVGIGFGSPGNVSAVTSTNALPVTAQPNSGIDIGDVTVNNNSAAPVPSRLGDGTSQITLTTANGDSVSNSSVRLPVNARLDGYNGATWDRLRAGLTGVQTTFTGLLNTVPMARYNATPYSLSNGQMVELQADSSGVLLVNPGVQGGNVVQVLVSVATTAADVFPANAFRKSLRIQNQDATNPIWVSFTDGVTATATASFYKIPAGTTDKWEAGDFVPRGRLNMISTGGTVSVQILEGN